MKLLLDSCVWGGAVQALRNMGYDVVSVSEWHEDPGDEKVLEFAVAEDRVLITLDKDFGDLVVHGQLKHAGLIRLSGFRARHQAIVCTHLVSRFRMELLKGAIVTASPGKVRVRTVNPPTE